ncbi:MAG: hypothetical protein V4699_02490 [Patescibacteria group bacterium]
MKNKTLIRFVQSFILLPGLAMSSAPVGPVSQAVINMVNSPSVFLQKQNTEAVDPAVIAMQSKADAIDNYFKVRNMPLEGMGMKMVLEAEKNDLDWRLIAAISVRESTGGKHECKKVGNNAFGWGSCKIGFSSNEVAIETVARNLGGNNPKTAHHYDEKTTIQILRAYNPPSIVPRYAEQVISIMNAIGAGDVTPVTPVTT